MHRLEQNAKEMPETDVLVLSACPLFRLRIIVMDYQEEMLSTDARAHQPNLLLLNGFVHRRYCNSFQLGQGVGVQLDNI